MQPENEYAGIDTPQPGDPGWDIDQWDEQVTEPLPVVRVIPPAPGRVVLACRCGRGLDLADMQRKKRRPTQDPMTIQPIVCPECTT